MDATTAWDVIIKQSPLIAFMALVIFYGMKYISKTLNDAAIRETAREQRYNTLVDNMMSSAEQRTESVVKALVANTAVMERVEKKLDESTH